MQHKDKNISLGRGLDSLLGLEEDMAVFSEASPAASFSALPIDQIYPGRYQPRQLFSPQELQELQQSIELNGVLQPILVRPFPGQEGRYEIVAGERRWQAAKRAGLSEIPVVVKELTDQQTLEVGLIENIQRQNLNPIEEAQGYARLVQEFGHSHEGLARLLGKSRSHITNCLRLLSLPDNVQDYVKAGRLSVGHARSLINVTDPEDLANKVLSENLNVRDTESLVRENQGRIGTGAPSEYQEMTGMIEQLTGLLTRIRRQKSRGEVILSFNSMADLDRLLEVLSSGRTALDAAA
jgi:ParB family chromosome partitioning protein